MFKKQLTYQLMKLRPKGVVLMYHRIAEPATDVWRLSVSPENFRQQLDVLREFSTVALGSLVSKRRNWWPARRVALTFDDGYVDNYTQAAPLLEAAALPASFFITTDFVGSRQWFWWDALEKLLLQSPELPSGFTFTLNGTVTKLDLAGEERLTPALQQQLKNWYAEDSPPCLRAAAYVQVWELLRFLDRKEQIALLDQLHQQAGQEEPAHALTMTASQLQALNEHPLFSIEAHTLSHPMLANWPVSVQEHEIKGSREKLERLLSVQADFFTYPHGNYQQETLAIAQDAGFRASFTTEPELVRSWSEKQRLGRFMVLNWTGPEFKANLLKWFEA